AGEAEYAGDDLLGVRRVLGRGVHEQLVLLVEGREGDVRLQVEVVLAAQPELAAQGVLDLPEDAPPIAAANDERLGVIGLAGDGRVQGEDRGEGRVPDRASPRAEAGRRLRLTEHPGDGLAVVDHLGREERLVAADRADVVLARDVAGDEDGDHARRRPRRLAV